jgi:hypothetical protein
MNELQAAKHLLQSTTLNTNISSNAAKFTINNKSLNFLIVSDKNFLKFGAYELQQFWSMLAELECAPDIFAV